MSKKREFPILNGKLISDLDANGHKIIGADIEVPAEKIKEAVAPELEAKADKTELEAETQRATGVEATLGNAITAEAQRAQEAEAALREGKADKVANATSGNLAALDENGNLVDSGNRVAGAFAADSFIGGGSGMVEFELDSTDKWVELYIGLHGGVILKFPLHGDTLAVQEDIAPTFDETDTYDEGALVFHNGLYCCVNPNGHTGAWVAADFAVATVEDVLTALRTAVAGKADASSLAPVATSGNYDDLRGKPGNVSAFANDAGYLTSHQQLRYAMPESVALVAQNDAATLVCADRAVTNATIASGFSTLNLTFPAAVSGYVRDFYLRITVAAGESAPAISVPQGITIENAGGAVPEIADGEASAAATTLVWFSETAPGVFTTKSETVKAVV